MISDARILKPTKTSNLIIGNSSGMVEAKKKVKKIAKTNISVFLSGATGVGKTQFARLIHNESKRKRKPFVKINCAAIPDNLIESELFGHERGAFTGANKRIGKFEYADNGTIVLDEIAEMPLYLQAKLLNVLEDKEITPLGSNKKIPCNFRLITASNKDLIACVKNNRFREDLYYRINAVEINISPLRMRMDDLLPLMDHFVIIYCNENNLNIKRFSKNAENIFLQYSWPGNVRQLMNACKYAVIFSEGDIIKTHDLPKEILGFRGSDNDASTRQAIKDLCFNKGLPFYDIKKIAIDIAREDYKYSQKKISTILGISQPTLSRHISKFK
jgi:transcriptional regulator with PAS, ATPase and Fis domain